MHIIIKIYQSTLALRARLLTPMLALLAITALAFATAPVAHAELDIQLTYIGKAGNEPTTVKDQYGTEGSFGAVDYNYYIGTTEVTNAQYAEFLNSVAKTDTYGLYNEQMGRNDGTFNGGINRSGGPGSYTYTVREGCETNPVNYISFCDAARFCNWLTNGANATADTETGMYKLSDGGFGMTRDATAWAAGGYAIPSENEWFKAAYFNLQTETYTLYATGDTISTSLANYNSAVGHITAAGSYPVEQNGTYDMMGNVFEWTESIITVYQQDYRCIRGSSFSTGEGAPKSTYINGGAPDYEQSYNDFGFRISRLVTSVPEPGTYGILAGAAALLGAVVLRRRPRRD